MKIIPVLTEKSFSNAKDGFYTFWVEKNMDKREIKKAIESTFDVHVTGVRTMNFRRGTRKNLRGKTITEKAAKKAVVTLEGDEKIDLFEEKKGK